MKHFRLLLSGAMFFTSFLLFAAVGSAASIYQVDQTTATVGTAQTYEIEYTLDTGVQTWADGDTLTVQLPATLPQWASLSYAVEYDDDVTNNATSETAIAAGGANGEYAVSTDTLTIKFDATTWTLVDDASTIRISINSGAIPQYAGTASSATPLTATFTFAGTTAAGGDTNPSGTDTVSVSAADAAGSLALGANSVVGTAGNTTLTVTLPVALDNGDLVAFTAPANLDVSSVAFGSETFAGGGSFTGCTDFSQVITCTSSGAHSAGTGTIVLTGIVSTYASSDVTISGVEVLDNDANADLARDTSGAITATTASDAAATITLGDNARTSGTGSTTLSFTLGYAMASGDTVVVTLPSNLSLISLASAATDTFAGAGSFTCTSSSQVLTCTADGAITAGTGTIVLSGIYSTEVASNQTLTSFAVNDSSASGADISSDSSGTVTNTYSVGGSGGGSSSSSSSTTTSDDDSEDSSDDESSDTSSETATDVETEETIEATGFTDVSESHWAFVHIQAMAAAEIVEGNPDGSFAPDASLNRAEIAVMLNRILSKFGTIIDILSLQFSDVEESAWYAEAVLNLKELTVVEGNPDGTYRPSEAINRAEFITIVLRLYKAVANETQLAALAAAEANVGNPYFLDVAADAWYFEEVQVAQALGFVEGKDCDNVKCYMPSDEINRAEAVTILNRVFGTLLL